MRAPNATMIPAQLASASGRRNASATTGRSGQRARLGGAGAQHRLGEIGADHLARERGIARDAAPMSSVPAQRSTYVPRGLRRHSSAAIARLRHAAIDVRAEHVIEEVVARRDLREDAPHVRTFRASASGRGECLFLLGYGGHSAKSAGGV